MHILSLMSLSPSQKRACSPPPAAHCVSSAAHTVSHAAHEAGHTVSHAAHEAGHNVSHAAHNVSHAAHEAAHRVSHAAQEAGHSVTHAAHEAGHSVTHAAHNVAHGAGHLTQAHGSVRARLTRQRTSSGLSTKDVRGKSPKSGKSKSLTKAEAAANLAEAMKCRIAVNEGGERTPTLTPP